MKHFFMSGAAEQLARPLCREGGRSVRQPRRQCGELPPGGTHDGRAQGGTGQAGRQLRPRTASTGRYQQDSQG